MKKETRIQVEENQSYFLCTCELSSKYPLCDGSHKGSAMKSLKYTAPCNQKIEWHQGNIKVVEE